MSIAMMFVSFGSIRTFDGPFAAATRPLRATPELVTGAGLPSNAQHRERNGVKPLAGPQHLLA